MTGKKKAHRKPRRSKAQLTRDRRRIADLYLQGWIQADIAEELGLSQSTISNDLKTLHKQWLHSALIDFNEAKAQELAKIDRLEREYWQAWQDSKRKKETTTTEQTTIEDGKREKAQIRREERTGDPRFLQGVQWCITQRCKILGVEAPQRHEVAGKDGGAIVVSVGGVDLAKDV